MASDRRYIPASEFCASVRDGTHDSPKPFHHGRKLVTSKNLTSGRLDLSDAYLISEEDFAAINKRSKVDQWDVLISMIGTVGEPCLIKEEPDFAIKNIGLFKPKSELDAKWLYYYLRSPEAKQRIKEQARGTTQQYIPLGALRDFLIPLAVNLEEQKAIARILGTLDDKIELNRRMNATLEAMARALFQSWFVDFDPVHAKAAGRPPSGMDAPTAALFPDKFQDSALGEIPEGWAIQPISSLCTMITSGGTPSRKNTEYWSPAEIPWFKTGELLDGPLIDAEELISTAGLENSSCKLWPADTVLFALYASPTVGRLGVLSKPGTANQAAAALIAKKEYGTQFLVGSLLEARAELQRVAVGAAQQNINQGVLKSHEIITPPPALAKAYSDRATPLFEMRIKLAAQSRTLATLRDTLLPKLLSGELSTATAA